MKKTKKILISFAAGILVTTSVATLATNTNQVHAVETTEQSPKAAEGILTLNHKARVYNKKGQKRYSYLGGNGLLKTGAAVKYASKVEAITDPAAKRYSFRDNDWNWFYLPYKTIKGKEYYNIGHGGYIKASNVAKIDDQYLYTNEITLKVGKKYPNGEPIIGTNNKKKLKTGQKIVFNRVTTEPDLIGKIGYEDDDTDGDSQIYCIKGSKEYVYLDNDFFRQPLLPYTNFTDVLVTENTNYYTENGQKYVHHVAPNEITVIGNGLDTSKITQTVPVSEKGTKKIVTQLVYLWVPEEQKAELFYQLLDNFVYPEENKTLYLKASSVKYIYGKQLQPINTAEEVSH